MKSVMISRSFSSRCLMLLMMRLRVLSLLHQEVGEVDLVDSSFSVIKSCIMPYCFKITSLRTLPLELSNFIGNFK